MLFQTYDPMILSVKSASSNLYITEPKVILCKTVLIINLLLGLSLILFIIHFL